MTDCLTALCAIVCLATFYAQASGAEVTAERSDWGVVFKIDGEVFTEYLTRAGQSPAMWPILAANGLSMTRAFPIEPKSEGGTDDHPHHQSLWFTHDQVNGIDFWNQNKSRADGEDGPRIEQREIKAIQNNGSTAHIVTTNDWMDGDRQILSDERKIVVGTHPNGHRWIDFTIELKATDGDVTFGDTKEGTFAVRVADSMRVEANRGGKIVNSDGQTNGEAWGLPAKWVDYTGPVSGETVGIAIMSHPNSFRPTPRWHVREYGLFAANPFGERDFPQSDAAEQGATTIKEGDSLTFRYRVLLHRGETNANELNEAFEEFAASEF